MGKERCEEVAPGSSVAIGKESGLRASLSHDGLPKKYGILRDIPSKNIKVSGPFSLEGYMNPPTRPPLIEEPFFFFLEERPLLRLLGTMIDSDWNNNIRSTRVKWNCHSEHGLRDIAEAGRAGRGCSFTDLLQTKAADIREGHG